MAILVTGGAGYIGSHTCTELIQAGYEVILVDNFSNSKLDVVNNIRLLTDKAFTYYKADLLEQADIRRIFEQHEIEAVIHFAALKSVGESVTKPLLYYTVNLTGTLNLLNEMERAGVKKLVFSSTAAVYGEAEEIPIKESNPLQATNPYGRTKQMMEQVLLDLTNFQSEWGVTLLRYFNPVGAHPSGKIGEEPVGTPDNLMPYLTQVAAGKYAEFQVYGNDYATKDGTGIRDYIHVVDLAKGHVKALEYTLDLQGTEAFNLGTGTGYSVLEVIKTFQQVTGKQIPYKVTSRRPGDVGVSYADPSKAYQLLQWKAEKSLEEMCRDAWNWQEKFVEEK